MPYISKKDRERLANEPGFESFNSIGEVNYIITTIMHDYIDQKDLSYTTINELIGVLECAKMELYRRIAVPYENKKIKENGDVLNMSHENLRTITEFNCRAVPDQKWGGIIC
jgi:hypothetical protein